MSGCIIFSKLVFIICENLFSQSMFVEDDTVNKKNNTNLVILFLTFLGILEFNSSMSYALGETQQTDVPEISISGKNRTLENILGEVSQQSGYRIEISESLLTQKVGGEYVDIEIGMFFNRTLKDIDIFQVIDVENKVIKILATARKYERTLVVDKNDKNGVESSWLDGEPGKTSHDLRNEQADVYATYKQGEQRLDGEPGKTFQDLLDERELVYKDYNPAKQKLDGGRGETVQGLLDEQDEVYATYKQGEQQLDGEPGKTFQDLLDERELVYENYSQADQELDGEPGRTVKDLISEQELFLVNEQKNDE